MVLGGGTLPSALLKSISVNFAFFEKGRKFNQKWRPKGARREPQGAKWEAKGRKGTPKGCHGGAKVSLGAATLHPKSELRKKCRNRVGASLRFWSKNRATSHPKRDQKSMQKSIPKKS